MSKEVPRIFGRMRELMARYSTILSLGLFIEDKSAGTGLLQQMSEGNLGHGWRAEGVDSKITALGKDNRGRLASDAVFMGKVKFTPDCYHKTFSYKGGMAQNHQVAQVVQFSLDDPNAMRRSDDCFDNFCNSILTCIRG